MTDTFSYLVSEYDVKALIGSETLKQRKDPKTLDGWVVWIQNHLQTCGVRIAKMPTESEIRTAVTERLNQLMELGLLVQADEKFWVTPAWEESLRWQIAIGEYAGTNFTLLQCADPDYKMMAVPRNGSAPVRYFKTPEDAVKYLYDQGETPDHFNFADVFKD